MACLTELQFNPKEPTLMHIDINSCFATIEQQANKQLRGKPIAVAAYKSDSGCILAPSIEAKILGIKVGMRVKEGKLICPNLIVLEPDPWKYRNVHIALKNLLKGYTEAVSPKSIDEFVINLEGFPAFKKGILKVAEEIKYRIKNEIGEWIAVSIGISTNKFLAKLASGLKKPDGLEIINSENHIDIFKTLRLTDLHGIKTNNSLRLNKVGIFSVMDFYKATPQTLYNGFHSIVGYHWYLRLKGWEVDDVIFSRKSYGNSVALYEPLKTPEELAPVLLKLVEKMTYRMRNAGYEARGVHVSLLYRNGNHWHKGMTSKEYIFAANDVYRKAYKILLHSPYKETVHTIAVSCFDLKALQHKQMYIFEDENQKRNLTDALDKIADKWGNYVITPAKMLGTKNIVKDRVAFGGIKELEEFIFKV